MCAQCGGAIAGTALVNGIEGISLQDAALNQRKGAFGLEFVLTFLIVYAYCASRVDYAARTGSAHQPPPGSGPYGTTAGHQGHYGTSGTLGAPTGLFGSGGGIFGGGYRLELHFRLVVSINATYTTLQSMINAKLSQHRFWPCLENALLLPQCFCLFCFILIYRGNLT